MSFGSAIKTCFRKYFVLSGRAARSEFWWFILFLILLSIVAEFMDAMIFGWQTVENDEGGPIAVVTSLATLAPYITVTVRRLHDSGRPGYYIFAPLLFVMGGIGIGMGLGQFVTTGLGIVVGIVIIAGILLHLWWLTRPSEPGPNRYGPNPADGPENLAEVFD